jgi:hypothetical protein
MKRARAKRYNVLLTRELSPKRSRNVAVRAEALYVEAPSKDAARAYLAAKYPTEQGWELQQLDPVRQRSR